MTLPPQKYSNTTRTISGILNIVYENDVVLLCDTSLGAVELELAKIPTNFWSTQYKLYVVDISNNASVNNITIKAPTGFTVNNSPSVTLNTNGADAVFSIGSNTNYLYSNGGAPSTSGLVSLTYAALQNLINNNNVVAGQFYLVTNAIFTNTVVETVPVVIQGVSTNEVALSGSGIFLNADYQNVGDYSGQVTYVSNLGMWLSTLVPVLGSVVIWNNLHWINITGSNGIVNPELDTTNWLLLPKTSTNGYIQEVDTVEYKVSSNQILSRQDVRGNYAENNLLSLAPLNEAFLVFQWGNNQVQNNEVSKGSVFDCRNNFAIGNPVGTPFIFANSVKISRFRLLKNTAEIRQNVLQGSGVTLTESSGTFSNNSIENSSITATSILNSDFSYNVLSNSSQVSIVSMSNQATCLNNVFQNNSIIQLTLADSSNFENNFVSNGCALNIINSGIQNAQFCEIKSNVFENEIVLELTNQNAAKFKNNNFKNSISAVISNIGDRAFFQKNNFCSSTTVFTLNNESKYLENDFNDFGFSCVLNSGEIGQNTISNGGYMTININDEGRIAKNIVRSNGSETTLVPNGFKIEGTNKGVVFGNVLNGGRLWLDSLDAGAQVNYNQISGTRGLTVSGNIGSLGRIEDNVIESDADVVLGTVNGFFGRSTKSKGNIVSTSRVTVNNIDSGLTFGTNVIQQESVIEIQSLTAIGQLTNVTFINTNVFINQILVEFANCTISRATIGGGFNFNEVTTGGNNQSFINTIRQSLDLSDPSIYDLPTQKLTIPVNKRGWVGTFNLLNAAGLSISKIEGISSPLNAVTFFPDSGTVNFVSVAVGVAAGFDIVSSGGATTYTLTSHSANTKDYISLTTNLNSTINLVYSTLILL